MSFLKQQKDFQASMASAASKYSKRVFPTPQPSSITAVAKSQQRSTPEPTVTKSKTVYSQPADTGTGQNIQTMVLYARDYLKEKGTAMQLDDILGFLSQQNAEQPFKAALATILQRHAQIDFDKDGFNGKGSYTFKPKHAIRNGTDLLAALQAHSTFKGLPVKELKEGWPSVEAGITELENEKKVLALRNKKDNTARFVWADDPTLAVKMEDEFRDMWKTIKVPADEQALIDAVVREGQQPTGKVNKKVTNKGPTRVEKKSKKPRRGGKTTNKHMVGILKDFSHLRR